MNIKHRVTIIVFGFAASNSAFSASPYISHEPLEKQLPA
jgi:hypothetical protein